MSCVVPLQAAHLDAATTLFVDSFVDDIGMHAICGAGQAVLARHSITAWFRATLRLQLATQQPAWAVVADERLVGATLLTAPDRPSAPRAWLAWMAAVGTQCGWDVIRRTALHERRRAAYRPKQRHAVLEFIAVRADTQGQGLGTRLVEAAHSWNETHPSVPGMWLETTRPARIPWFERRGYRVMGRIPLAQGTSWYLFRAAK